MAVTKWLWLYFNNPKILHVIQFNVIFWCEMFQTQDPRLKKTHRQRIQREREREAEWNSMKCMEYGVWRGIRGEENRIRVRVLSSQSNTTQAFNFLLLKSLYSVVYLLLLTFILAILQFSSFFCRLSSFFPLFSFWWFLLTH